MPASPPLDFPVRRGPVSRWRRPMLPISNSSPIRTAILSAEPIPGARVRWNELPPAEELRGRMPVRPAESDAPADSHFGEPPDPVRFVPQPISQPNWLTPRRDAGPQVEASTAQIQFRQPVADDPFDRQPAVGQGGALDAIAGPLIGSPHGHSTDDETPSANEPADSATLDAVSPLVISDRDESPQDWLTQAQRLAQSAESIEDLSAIVNLCQRGLANGPADELTGPLERMAAWAHNRRGEMLIDSDRQEEAFRDFQAAIACDPNCSLAIHNRAVTLAQLNEAAAALRDFNRVIELNPGLAIAYRNRAELLASLGRIEEALADYTRAIEGLPGNAELYCARGSAWHRAGDYEQALADLNRALEIVPNADAFTQRGNVAAERGEFDNALRDLRQALEADPTWAEAYRSLAWLYATCADANYRDPQQALAAAQRAVDLSEPGDCFVLDALAAAHASAGAFEEAARVQLQALATAPPDYLDPLRQRLTLYEQGQPFVSGTLNGAVRAASHSGEVEQSSRAAEQ
jgi:tetratricopeptide (TPR) repeat protein